MPGKHRPSHQPHVRAEKARRKRYGKLEATATAWCVLCGAPAKNQHGAYVHEGHVHKAAS